MAKRRVSSAPPPKESHTVLIFFLVFSVLLNLGLGVATYFGFQHDDKIKAENQTLTKESDALKDNREWWQFQALSYRKFMGQLPAKENETLALLREKFDNGRLAPKTTAPDKEEATTFIKTTLEKDKNLSWKDPNKTYEGLIAELTKSNQSLTALNKQLLDDKDKAEKRKASAEKELADEITTNKTLLAQLQKDSNVKLDSYFKSVQVANNELENRSKQIAEQKTNDDLDKHKIEKDLTIAQIKIRGYLEQIDKLKGTVARLEKDLGHDAPGVIKTDWKIVSIDRNGAGAYINLGTADKVTSGLTFRVHGIGEDGKPKQRDKATVEVLKAVGDHLSSVRVLYDYDEHLEPRPQRHNPRTDPVLTGDILYNPTWDPYQKKHVAIAGPVDLIGDGTDSLPEFIRSLERQNVVVDAYLDMKDLSVKGPGITVNTDLLIVSPLPKSLVDPRGPDADRKKALIAAVTKLKREADDNGVRKRGLRQYLEEIGFRVPKGLSDEGADYVPAQPVKETPVPPKPDVPKPDVPKPDDAPPIKINP